MGPFGNDSDENDLDEEMLEVISHPDIFTPSMEKLARTVKNLGQPSKVDFTDPIEIQTRSKPIQSSRKSELLNLMQFFRVRSREAELVLNDIFESSLPKEEVLAIFERLEEDIKEADRQIPLAVRDVILVFPAQVQDDIVKAFVNCLDILKKVHNNLEQYIEIETANENQESEIDDEDFRPDIDMYGRPIRDSARERRDSIAKTKQFCIPGTSSSEPRPGGESSYGGKERNTSLGARQSTFQPMPGDEELRGKRRAGVRNSSESPDTFPGPFAQSRSDPTTKLSGATFSATGPPPMAPWPRMQGTQRREEIHQPDLLQAHQDRVGNRRHEMEREDQPPETYGRFRRPPPVTHETRQSVTYENWTEIDWETEAEEEFQAEQEQIAQLRGDHREGGRDQPVVHQGRRQAGHHPFSIISPKSFYGVLPPPWNQVPAYKEQQAFNVHKLLQGDSMMKFSGNIREYPGWRNAFITTIHLLNIPTSHKTFFLLKCLEGGDKVLKHSLSLLRDDPEAYAHMVWSLEERYGGVANMRKLALLHIQEMRPVISGDINSLLDFVESYEHIGRILKGTGAHLDNLTTYDSMISCIPENYEEQYADWCDRNECEPAADTLHKWAKSKVHKLHSFNSKGLLPTKKKLLPSRPPVAGNSKALAVTHEQADDPQEVWGQDEAFKAQPMVIPTCTVCKQKHLYRDCDAFKKMTPKERQTHLAASKKCFRCLREGRNLRDCKSKLLCRNCKSKHHTLLCTKPPQGDKAHFGPEVEDHGEEYYLEQMEDLEIQDFRPTHSDDEVQ